MATSIKTDDELKGRIQQLPRESFKKEALASWAAYQETGRHLTGQEARTWLGGWGTDGEAELPTCHD